MTEVLQFVIAFLIHESGHFISAGLLGVPLVSFTPVSIGAVMSFDFSNKSYISEAIVHASGSALGIAFALLSFFIIGERATYFLGISITLSAVNLLPIIGFDGGGITKCLLSRLFLPDNAWRICKAISIISIVILWTAVLWIELRTDGNMALMVFILSLLVGMIK